MNTRKKLLESRKEILALLSKKELIDLAIRLQLEVSEKTRYVSECKNRFSFYQSIQRRKMPVVHEDTPYSSKRLIKQEI